MIRFLSTTLVFWAIHLAGNAHACAVCTGARGTQTDQAMSIAIVFMLGVLLAVLSSFGAFFIYLQRRSSEAETAAPGADS